ncbi:MAG: helix-turn-helix transcriptional regulator [Phycisphaeraceae bacterium]|nr:helix-turn-helix transcriptional regulator [Phycisphaeraceae bacterium]
MRDDIRLFGSLLREKRLAKGYSLRKFAELADVSPTYLSQVEQGKVERPPTAERLRKMAELLGENANQWIAMAGRLPDSVAAEIADRMKREPEAIPALLRATKGLTADELRRLTEQIEQDKQTGGNKP